MSRNDTLTARVAKWTAGLSPLTAWLAIAVATALLLPTTASAHGRTGVVAVDQRARVFPLHRPLRAAVAVRVYEADQAIRLTVRPGHGVAVLGYAGEPFLRLSTAGLAVNSSSPTAAGVGLLKPDRPSAGAPRWHLRAGRSSAVWHDLRVRALAPSMRRRAWSLPVIVDGHRASLVGEVWRVPAPSPRPWLIVGALVVSATALLLKLRRSLLRRCGIVLGVVCAVLTIVTAAAFALAPSASAGRWIEGANELAFAAVGLAVLAWAPTAARPIAGGALGLLAVWVGASKVSVFAHGVVLSAFPATLSRALVLCTLSAGAAAIVVGVAMFTSPDERPRPPLVSKHLERLP